MQELSSKALGWRATADRGTMRRPQSAEPFPAQEILCREGLPRRTKGSGWSVLQNWASGCNFRWRRLAQAYLHLKVDVAETHGVQAIVHPQ